MLDDNRLNVLDWGFVRLVDSMGSDLSIARAAKVSYDAAWRAGEDKGSDARLINYLWDHHHSTPFEAVVFTFEVKAPIFIFRQWHRHRTWSFNELSARYRELPEEFYVPNPATIGEQSSLSKQARVQTEHSDHVAADLIQEASRAAFNVYHTLLERKVPREVARSVLPMNTYSHMFATVDLLNLMKFLTLRDHEHAQWEMQQYAKALATLIEPIVPGSHGFTETGLKTTKATGACAPVAFDF